jgi:hypothetical protein
LKPGLAVLAKEGSGHERNTTAILAAHYEND